MGVWNDEKRSKLWEIGVVMWGNVINIIPVWFAIYGDYNSLLWHDDNDRKVGIIKKWILNFIFWFFFGAILENLIKKGGWLKLLYDLESGR